MSRRFIATVVIAALTVTAIGNAPARADEALGRTLATIFGAAIVGAFINEKLDDDKKNKVVTRRYSRNDATAWSKKHSTDQVIRRVGPRPLPRRVKQKLLPGNCLRSFDTRNGRARVFGKECLEKNYNFTRNLPHACAVKFWTHKKNRQGYDARCLRNQGYLLARQ